MDTKDYFKNIYKDFYGIESTQVNNSFEKGSQDNMTSFFERINKLNVTEQSKDLLKKMIEYMRMYSEKKETNYIPYRIILTSNTKETLDEIEDILYKTSKLYGYINDNSKNINLYNSPKELDFNGFITINGIEGMIAEDRKEQNKFIYYLEENLKKNNLNIIIIEGSNSEISNFFLGKEKLKKEFSFIIEGINPDKNDIYNYVLEHVKLTDEQKVSLLDYISNTYNDFTDYEGYQKYLVHYISFHKEIPIIQKEKTIDEIFFDLDELVGLERVKKVLRELVDVIKLKEKANYLNIKDMNLHMVFLGNPGTGKTTIARMISEILYNLKYIKENKLVEVSVKDLVAEYVGQTAPKTMSVIEKSLNGVLFIDEAYSLAVKGDNNYNAEAIATLIQAMEDYRDRLVVIFAGYTKEMQAFLDSNSGIVSRIGYTLEFEDYTTDQLAQIFINFMHKSGFDVTDEAITYLKKIIDENRDMKNFGNARFVRNIYEKTIVKHASNVKNKKQKHILKTITKDDISVENLILK